MRSALRLLIFLCVAVPVAAQITPRQLFGFGAGGSIGMQSGEFPVFGNSTNCGVFVSGIATSSWFGLMSQFPGAFSDQSGLSVGLRVANATTVYTADSVQPVVVFDGETQAPTEIAREYLYTVGESVVSLELLGHFHLGGGFAVMGGGWVGMRSGTTTEQSERSLDERYFFNGGRDRDTLLSPNLLPTFNPLALGLQIGGSYEILLTKKMSLQPELMVRFDPGTQIAEMTWRRFSVAAGAHLLFDLVPEPAVETPAPIVSLPEPPNPVAPAPTVTPAAKLTASLDLRALDTDETDLTSATVTIYQTHVRRVMPFPRSVDFLPNSAALPTTYRKLSGALESQVLVDSLASSPRDIIEAHMLNLLGMRMRENPSDRISLTGATAREEASWLAYARVETVRSYLQSVWGIDAGRIDVQASPEGTRSGGRLVEISGPVSLVGPIDLLRTDNEFEPPKIRIAPSWDASAGVRNWAIRFRHGRTEIGSFDSRQSSGNSMASLDWQILNSPARQIVEPLSAELTVEDSAGGSVRAADTLPLRLDRRSRLVYSRIDENSSERVVYTLYPALAESRNRELISSLLASLPSGAKLSVATLGNERGRGVEMIAELRRRNVLRRGIKLAGQPTQLDSESLVQPGTLGLDQLGSLALVVDLPAPR